MKESPKHNLKHIKQMVKYGVGAGFTAAAIALGTSIDTHHYSSIDPRATGYGQADILGKENFTLEDFYSQFDDVFNIGMAKIPNVQPYKIGEDSSDGTVVYWENGLNVTITKGRTNRDFPTLPGETVNNLGKEKNYRIIHVQQASIDQDGNKTVETSDYEIIEGYKPRVEVTTLTIGDQKVATSRVPMRELSLEELKSKINDVRKGIIDKIKKPFPVRDNFRA